MAEEVITPTAQPAGYPGEASRDMIEAGVFYGRKKSKTNPKMRQFVIANRGGVEVINLQKTEEEVDRAAEFVKGKVAANGLGLLVATEPAAEGVVLELARKFSMPYVTLRWIGGTITNFKIILKRVDHLKKLRADLASGALDKYTKKERVDIDREIKRLESLMGGLENLPREPDFLLMVDPNLHSTAVREARIKKIPIVALSNVDADPDVIDYLVPGNDKAKKSIEWFFGKIEKAIEDGIKARIVVPVEASATSATPSAPIK